MTYRRKETIGDATLYLGDLSVMQVGVFRSSHYSEVLNPVVGFNPINMMHEFIQLKGSP